MAEVEAVLIVHWPGKDVPACIEHAAKLKSLAGVLGLSLSMTASMDGEMCSNCANAPEAGDKPLATKEGRDG